MGTAAYNRASAVVSQRIRDAYKMRSQDDSQVVARAEELIQQFDQFSRNAQALYWDSVYEESAKGTLKSLIHANYLRKREQKRFLGLMAEACTAHNAWVNCDSRDTVAYLKVARCKAMAWHGILACLNRSIYLPFSTPNFGT